MKETKKLFLKRLLATTFLASTILPMLSPVGGLLTQNVFAETGSTTKDTASDAAKEKKTLTETKLITAPGFFTKELSVKMGTCETHKEKVSDFKEAQKDKITKGEGYDEKLEDSFDSSEKDKGRETKAVNELMGTAADAIITPEDSKEPDKGIFGIGCGEFNFMKFLARLIEPVNITQSSVIMSLVYKFQIVALGVGVLLVAVFGLYYATGNETTDPVKFLIRGFFTLWFVYYLPFFAQDILNVNNMLVYWISTDEIKGPDVSSALSGVVVGMVSVTNIVIGALTSALYLNVVPGFVFVGLIILAVVVGFLLKHIFTMLFWWYSRLLMIIFLVMLGPIFMVMMILPKTASYGQRWIKYFVGETFTQASMVIGMYFASYILANLGTLNAETNMGLFGNTLLIYGLYLLLARIPQISKNHIGGADIGGLSWGDAQRVGQSIGDFAQKAGFAIAGNYARNQVKKRDLAEEEELLRHDNDSKNENLSREKRDAALEKMQRLEEKIGERNARGDWASRMGAATLKGDYKTALGDLNDLRRKAADEAKSKDGEREKRIKAENAGLSKKLISDADKGREEVIDSLQKDKVEEEARHNREMDKIERDEAEAKKRHGENYDKEAFDVRRKDADRKHKKNMAIINSNLNSNDYIDAQARKLQDVSRQNLEKIAEAMVGDQYENQWEKRAAVTEKANELEKKYREDMKNEQKDNQMKKEAEQLEAKGDIGEKANQYTQAMNSGVSALSEELQKQGFSKGEADARAAQLIQKQAQLDELKNSNRKLLNTPLDKMNERDKAKYDDVFGQMKKLETEMNALGGAIDSEQVSEALGNSKNAVADILKKEGFSSEAAQKRASQILDKQAKIGELESKHGYLLNKDMNELDENERKQKLEALQQISGLQNEISALGGALTMSQVSSMLNNGHEGLTQMLEKQGFTRSEAENRASSIINNQSEIQRLDNLNNKIVKDNPNGLTNKQSSMIDENKSKISELEAENNSLSGGMNSKEVSNVLNNGTLAVSAALQKQGFTRDEAQAKATDMVQKQNQIDGLKSLNNEILNMHGPLTKEQQETKGNVLEKIDSLQSDINSIGNGVTSEQVSTLMKDGNAAINTVLESKGFAPDTAKEKANTIVQKHKEAEGIQSSNSRISSSNFANMSVDEARDMEKTLGELSEIGGNLTELSSGFTNADINNAATSGFKEINDALQKQGHSPEAIQARTTKMSQLRNQVDSIRSANDEVLNRSVLDLTKDELQQRQDALAEIANLESNIVSQSNGLNYSDVGNTLEPHMPNINAAKNAYNDVLSKHAQTLDSSANYGASVIASNIMSNSGGIQSFIESASGDNAKAFTQYLEGMGVGESASSIVQSLGTDIKEEMNYLNSPSVNGPANKSAIVNSFVDAAKASINPEVMSPQAIESFGQSVGEAAWENYTQTAPDSKKFSGAASNVGSGIELVNSVATKQIETPQVTQMFEDSGFTNSKVAAQQFVEHAPEIQSVISETLESGNTSKSDFQSNFVQATQGMDSGIQNGVATTVWKEISKGHSMDTRTQNAFGSGQSPVQTITEISAGAIQQDTFEEALSNNSVPNAPEVAQIVYENAEGIQGAITQTFQSSAPSKSQFADVVKPLIKDAGASTSDAIINTLWDGVTKDSSMEVPVATRTTQALGQSPAQVIEAMSTGSITQETLVEYLDEYAVPNSQETGSILANTADDINEILTLTVKSESPNGNSFREEAATTLISKGMDSKVANSVAGSIWTDAAKNISMDSRFDNAWESTEKVIDHLASPEADVDVVINTVTESMKQNAIPDAKETATALHSNASKIKEVIEVTVKSENPSVETAKTQLTGILSGVKNNETKKSLINSILKDITKKITGDNNPKPKPNPQKDKEKQ